MDTFTRVLYGAPVDARAAAFSALPTPLLQKLAFGSADCGDGHTTWISKFEGTSLHAQALELAQEELEQEMQDAHGRQELNSVGDQMRLKKKLLELELARTNMQPEPAGEVAAPTAASVGAPGAATQPTVMAPEGAPAKTAEAAWLEVLMDKTAIPAAGAAAPAALIAKAKALKGALPAVAKAAPAGASLRPGATIGMTSLLGKPSALPSFGKVGSAPIALLREMQKQAGVGETAWNFAKKYPGLVGGTVGGAALGGVRGSRQTIDPMTGQPTGGGLTGALTGGVAGGVLGGAGGLAAQGAIRAGSRAAKTISQNTKAGLTTPGGVLGQFGQEALVGGRGMMQDVGALGGHLQTRAGQAGNKLEEWAGTQRKAWPAQQALPKVAPPGPAPSGAV